MPWVRTRMQPHEDVWVNEAEHANLLELGILLGDSEDPPPDPDDVRLSKYVRDPGALTYGEIRAIAEQLAQEAVADAVRSGTITLIGSFDAPLTDGATPRPPAIAIGYWCMAAGVTPENAVNGDFIWTAA